MVRRSFAFILFVLLGLGANSAQTPEPKVDGDKSFAWTINGDGGYLGVQAEDISKGNLAKFGLREVKGVGVESIVDGSPAQTAGLQKGDVILKVNGDEITSTRKLSRLINEISPDHQARLTVLRGGSEREITVTLGKRQGFGFGHGAFGGVIAPMEKFDLPQMPIVPSLPPMTQSPLFRRIPGDDRDVFVFPGVGGRRIGVSVTTLTKQLSSHFGVAGGVLITDVRENSAGARGGLKAGDIVVEVEGKEIKDDVGLIRSIGEKKEGSVTLTIVRDRNRQSVTVTPEEMKGDSNHFFEFSTPDAPDAPAPGLFKLARPGVPMTPVAPVPLDRLMVPGRVI